MLGKRRASVTHGGGDRHREIPLVLHVVDSVFTLLYLYLFVFKFVCVFIYVWVFCRRVYLCTTCIPGASKSQKRVSEPLGLELQSYELSCGCWKLNPSPMEEQPVLLATKPSLLPLLIYFQTEFSHVV